MTSVAERLHEQLDLLLAPPEFSGNGVLEARLFLNCGGVRRTELEFKRAADGLTIIIGNPCVGCQK